METLNTKHSGAAPRPVTVKLITVHQLMTVPQLAEWLQVSPKTIYQWAHKRQIPFRKLGHRRNDRGRDINTEMRFDYYEILAWTQTGHMPEWFTEPRVELKNKKESVSL